MLDALGIDKKKALEFIHSKKKGNITSQRTHIRAKLGLTDPRADLRSALIERIERQAQ